MKMIIDIPEEMYDRYMNYTENYIDFVFFGTEEKIVRVIRNGIPLEEKTNGEVLKALFPKDFDGTVAVIKEADWWIAPYKENNKEVGCKNCANAPRTFEEFCLAKHSVDTSFCQDAFEEQAKKCNFYDKSLDKENKQ